MSKESVLKRLEKEWQNLQQSLEGVSAVEMCQPGAAGEWSVRDILAHVTTWDVEAVKNLPLILKFQKTPLYSSLYGGVDEFNRLEQQRKRDLSLAEVRRQLREAHARLVDYLEQAPAEAFISGSRFQRRLREDTYGHYPEHVRAIAAWKTRSK